MKSREIFFSALTLSFLAVGMAGCGGGGSSGGGGGAVVNTTPTVVISPANAPAVAGAAVETAVGAAATPIGVATSSSGTAASSATTVRAIGSIVVAEVAKFNNQSQTPVIVTGAVQTQNCPNGGTVSTNGAGTSGTITYANCSYMAGYSQTGTISISNIVSNCSGCMSANIVLNLTMVSPAETLTVQGDIAITQTPTTLRMAGSSLTYISSVSGTRTIYNYIIDEDLTTGAVTESFSVNSAALGGMATVTITTPFTYGMGLYPNGGVVTVTGANSTKLRVTVLGDETAPAVNQVMYELSTDGGTTYGVPIYITWASLNIII